MTRLVVIGGGAAGVLTAAAASRHAAIESIVLVSDAERVGPGLAYGTAAPHHRLNSAAGRMSAWEDDPGDFVRWSGDPASTFSLRRRYGDYLEAVAATLPRLTVAHARATAVADGRVVLDDGRALDADAVVLALGNPPPLGRRSGSARAVADPWVPGALTGVHGRVLLLGTGLTMVDVATTLARADPAVRMTATSRNLLLPRTHLADAQPPGPGIPGAPTGLAAVLRGFHARLRAAEAPWQAEVDGVRPQIDDLWRGLDVADRRRFVRHVSRHWEVHRHRMSPIVAAELQGLIDDGRLTVGAPGGEDVDVVDGTGPRPFAEPGWNPLVDALLAAGTARPDALGLGLDVDAEGRLRDVTGAAAPALFVVGPARRGTQWESTAIPEIRQHATQVAALVAALEQPALQSGTSR